MRRLTALFFFIQFSLGVKAQQLYFNHLTVDNGLSQGVNNCIYRDSRGLVWISSFDGLNRFDGISCDIYRSGSSNASGLRGTLFLNIVEDSSGNIWIGSNEGLNKYDRSTGVFESFSNSKNDNADNFYSPFYVDEKQNIWLQSGNAIYMFDVAKKQLKKITAAFNNGSIIVSLSQSSFYKKAWHYYVISKADTVLWKADVDDGKLSWQSFHTGIDHSKINRFFVDEESRLLYAGTASGLYINSLHAPAASATLFAGTGEKFITALHQDERRQLWIGTTSGLLKTNTTKSSIENEYLPSLAGGHDLQGKQVQYITTDKTGNLWVAIWGKGVDYTSLNKFRFRHYLSSENELPFKADNFIKSIVPVGNDIWCGTQSSGIIILDSNKQVKQVLSSPLPASIEHLQLLNNSVYAATFNGLFKIDVATKAISKITFAGKENFNNQYNYVIAVSSNTLLLSGNNNLYFFNVVKRPAQLVAAGSSFGGSVYLTTFCDSDSNFYISKPFRGFDICVLQHDSLISKKHIGINATVKCFYETGDTLWIGTTSGLLLFSKSSRAIQKIYSVSNGLSNQYIYGIVPYKNFLWLSTNAGINRFNIIDQSVKVYTTNDGLQSNEFNTYSFGRTKNNEILFGGVNGLNAFDPAAVSGNTTPPQLILSSLFVEDSLYHEKGNFSEIRTLEMPYRENTLSFQFTVLDYVSPAGNYFQYTLSGFDKHWLTATNKAVIRYARLPAGKYHLFVKAFNADGVMAPSVFSMTVIIDTPWWRTWWFVLLCLAAAIAIIASIIRAYFNRKLAKQKLMLEKELAIEHERNRMAQDLHDGLGGMLSGIKHSLSALTAKNLNSGEEIVVKSIGMLDNSIGELRRVAHNMMPETLLKFGLDATLRDYCYNLSASGNVQVAYQSYGLEEWRPQHEVSTGIFRMVQELVTNALKHAAASQVIVQLIKSNRQLNITIEDNGCGFDTAILKNPAGMGWNNLQHRVLLLHGKIEVLSEKDKGTAVMITCEV